MARRPAAPQTLTEEGTLLGTPQYMAPEQLEGRDADARSDLFAFGAVLYEMLTGRRAFPGESRSKVIAAVLDSDPPPIAVIQPLTPPALEHLVSTCLAKNPDERWQSAGDVKRQLEWIAESARSTAARGAAIGQSGAGAVDRCRPSLRASRSCRALPHLVTADGSGAGAAAARHAHDDCDVGCGGAVAWRKPPPGDHARRHAYRLHRQQRHAAFRSRRSIGSTSTAIFTRRRLR